MLSLTVSSVTRVW
uniref:Uncharacterized protein n=1 Tax=Arundo donax TaxID=35708 RepID=A0A0A9A143_ARUDO